MPWSALFLSAWAGAPELSSCCKAVGASNCPSELFAVGPGSRQTVGGNGNTVTGGWTLRCESGATYEPGRTMTTRTPAASGTVLGAVDATAAACFDVSCALPAGLCLRSQATGIAVVACDGGEPTVGMWSNPAGVPPGVRVVGGRLLGSDTHATPASLGSSAQTLDPAVPPPPPMPCVPSAALRQPSNDQVDQGNDAIVAGDLATATDRYRAAITINRCNAFAWAALGDALLQAGKPEPARAALVVATALMPSHFHAWTRLGEAEERLGNPSAAKADFEHALAAHPGHPPAVAGLGRTR